jgi:hypothetical protein
MEYAKNHSVPIKWTYATRALTDRPAAWQENDPRFSLAGGPPRMGDVLIARIANLGHHQRLDEPTGTRSSLYAGDVVGVVFSPRYATAQFEAIVPPSLERVQVVAGGGVCGLVVSQSGVMSEPTRLEPLGYLHDSSGARVKLAAHGIREIDARHQDLPVILSVGASMDSGKTTSASSLIFGLTRAGLRVGAAKLTGTAAAKDPKLMRDSGAIDVLDFAAAGYASTIGLSESQLEGIALACLSRLANAGAEVLVFELADGVMQRETQLMLAWFARRSGPTTSMFSCSDTFSVSTGVERLRRAGVRPIAVSGIVTSSPLSQSEAAWETDLPVLSLAQLRDPGIAGIMGPADALPNDESGNRPHVVVRGRPAPIYMEDD